MADSVGEGVAVGDINVVDELGLGVGVVVVGEGVATIGVEVEGVG
jgi:hypothetical protein